MSSAPVQKHDLRSRASTIDVEQGRGAWQAEASTTRRTRIQEQRAAAPLHRGPVSMPGDQHAGAAIPELTDPPNLGGDVGNDCPEPETLNLGLCRNRG